MTDSTVLKLPANWLKEPQYNKITILDPDGWDRQNFEVSWNTPISEEEFKVRMLQCTVQIMT